MALKDIFKMTKANRYTADGREELIKAQEAETEDRRYNIGEISEKTGLQKTANGWAKPKNGAGRNLGTEQKKRGPGAIHTPGKGNVGMDKMKEAAEKGLKGQELKEFMTGSKSESKPAGSEKWQKNTDYLGRERISMNTPQGGKVSIYESSNPKQKNARFRVDTGSHYNEFNTLEEAKAFAEKQYGRESKSEIKPTAEKQKTEKGPSIPKPSADDLDWAKGVASRNNVNPNDLIKNGKALKPGVKVSFNTPRDGDLKGEIVDIAGYDGKAFVTVSTPKGNRMISTEKITTDSAPRILTGDTRIRVRK